MKDSMHKRLGEEGLGNVDSRVHIFGLGEVGSISKRCESSQLGTSIWRCALSIALVSSERPRYSTPGSAKRVRVQVVFLNLYLAGS